MSIIFKSYYLQIFNCIINRAKFTLKPEDHFTAPSPLSPLLDSIEVHKLHQPIPRRPDALQPWLNQFEELMLTSEECDIYFLPQRSFTSTFTLKIIEQKAISKNN